MAIKRRGGNEAASTASDGSTASNIRKQQSHPRLLTSALLLGALLLAGYAAKQGFYLHSGPKSDPGTRAERDENGGAGEEAAAATETTADEPVAHVPTRLDVLSRWDPVEVNHTRLLVLRDRGHAITHARNHRLLLNLEARTNQPQPLLLKAP